MKYKIRTSFLYVGVTGLEPARLILCGPVPKTGRKPTTGYTPILSQNL